MGISKSTIHRWFHQFGDLGVKKRSKRKKSKKKKELCSLLGDILSSSPFVTLSQIREHFPTQKPSISTLSRTLKSLKYKRRKATIRPIYCDEENLMKKTSAFVSRIANVDICNVVSLDEVGFCTTDYSCFAYSRKPIVRKSFKTKKMKVSCCMAVSTSGILNYSVTDSSINKSIFLSFIDKLIPAMQKENKNIIVMDNINFHHSKDVIERLEKANIAVLFTPPYSPQYNPIELVFSLIKRDFRTRILSKTPILKAIKESISHVEKLYKDKMISIFIHCFVDECQKHLNLNE